MHVLGGASSSLESFGSFEMLMISAVDVINVLDNVYFIKQ